MPSGEHPLLIDDGAAAPVLAVAADGHVVRVHADGGLHAADDATGGIRTEHPC